jgi:hypothetical protein
LQEANGDSSFIRLPFTALFNWSHLSGEGQSGFPGRTLLNLPDLSIKTTDPNIEELPAEIEANNIEFFKNFLLFSDMPVFIFQFEQFFILLTEFIDMC